ncbi:MAG: acyl-CoA dehydratase activase-related protein [Tissierellaceae bacterium]
MKKIGIPRGMLYYEYFPIWKDFFEGIGFEVISSNRTNKEIMDRGILYSVDEACLPVKIIHGHVDFLKDKVDFLFIPKIMSIYKREYCCPKIIGLAEMIRNSLDDLPEILDVVYDFNKRRGPEKAYKEIAKTLGVTERQSSRSLKKADKGMDRLLDWLKSDILPDNYAYRKDFKDLLLLGHSYILFDDFINMKVVEKLIDKDINVHFPEDISDDISRKYSNFTKKRMFWTHGRRIIGASNYVIMNHKVDGIIYLSSFGCGLDSVFTHMASRQAAKYGIPFMNLTLDEQTGEAGINTRLEAFLDMMKWRDSHKDHISSFR